MGGGRILFCSHMPVSRTLGASKVIAEAAEAMRPWGWEATVVGPDAVWADRAAHPSFPAALRAYLIDHAAEYDVVDYDHVDLPYPRAEFAAGTLMVARSVLLMHHLLAIDIPPGPTVRQRLGHAVVRRRQHRRRHETWAATAQATCESADLVNVANDHDRRELVRHGIGDGKIVVLPYGIGADRRAAFEAVPVDVPAGPPRVAFVGTFDYRKGAGEMPDLFARIAAAVPGVGFDLLGTAAMFTTVEAVLGHFPRRLRERIRVVPRFGPGDLPGLLAGAWAGVFPSWLEGFGIGVLEMMAAAVPVVAYDAPGPPEMVPADHLVPPGDSAAMAAKVVAWLTDRAALAAARIRAREDSRRFDWPDIGRRTAAAYSEHLARLRGAKNPGLRAYPQTPA